MYEYVYIFLCISYMYKSILHTSQQIPFVATCDSALCVPQTAVNAKP